MSSAGEHGEDLPTQITDPQDSHTFTLVYDHRGRPIYITDKNNATQKERREQLYWNLEDDLIERVITPDASAPSTYSVDIFAHMESAATGWMRLEYVNGGFQSETRRYVVRDPSGLVAAVYTFTGTGATTVVYTADYQPFGEVRASSGTIEPGLGQGRQVAIVGSEARVWSGQTIAMLRSRLDLAGTLPVDPRVAARNLADAATWSGRDRQHPYSYPPAPAGAAITDTVGISPPVPLPLPKFELPTVIPGGRWDADCFEFHGPDPCGPCPIDTLCFSFQPFIVGEEGTLGAWRHACVVPSEVYADYKRVCRDVVGIPPEIPQPEFDCNLIGYSRTVCLPDRLFIPSGPPGPLPAPWL